MEQSAGKGLYRKIFSGFLLGVTSLLPGVSGGALAASLGYFEPVIRAISGFFRDARKSIAYLWPLAIGGIIGFALAALLLSQLINTAETQFVCLFLGMVAGSLPSVFRMANKERPKALQWLLMGVGFLCSILFGLLDSNIEAVRTAPMGYLQAVLAGGVLGIGVILPGLSSSFILIYLGWYKPVMNALVTFDLVMLLAVGVGMVAAFALLVKAVDWLFSHYRRAALCVVVGLVAGSLVLVFPDRFFDRLWYVNVALVCVGVAAGFFLGKMESPDSAKQS